MGLPHNKQTTTEQQQQNNKQQHNNRTTATTNSNTTTEQQQQLQQKRHAFEGPAARARRQSSWPLHNDCRSWSTCATIEQCACKSPLSYNSFSQQVHRNKLLRTLDFNVQDCLFLRQPFFCGRDSCAADVAATLTAIPRLRRGGAGGAVASAGRPRRPRGSHLFLVRAVPLRLPWATWKIGRDPDCVRKRWARRAGCCWRHCACVLAAAMTHAAPRRLEATNASGKRWTARENDEALSTHASLRHACPSAAAWHMNSVPHSVSIFSTRPPISSEFLRKLVFPAPRVHKCRWERSA